MIILTIFNANQTVYWVEHFNDIDFCNKWLEEEKTRPYWNSAFTYTIEDNTPTPEQIAQQSAEIQAQLQVKEQSKNSAKAKLTALGLTEEEIQAILGL